uniref:Na+/H+ antiporter subunit C n=1 Tax=Caenorhabditis tropicalis TaxID=1561998 RepID=A0A1I7U717_9PELO
MIEWLLLAAVLLLGMTIFRRIFMPLYIYLAVMATNGTLVLFVVKFKQFTEGKIPHDDLSLNLVGILLVTATAHNLVYLYAMHLHLNSRSYSRIHRPAAATAAPQAVAAPSQNEGKKDLSGLP